MSKKILFFNNPYRRYLSLADYDYLANYLADYLLEFEPKEAENVSECPECHGKVKKNGHSTDGLQRYKCLSCGHTFNSAGSDKMLKLLTYRSRIPDEKWREFIVKIFENSYLNKNSIPDVKGINKNTATRMASKIYEQIDLLSDALDLLIDNLTEKERKEIEKKQQ